MLINFKVKTLDAQTHDLTIDNEITVRELKDRIAEKTNIVPDQQRIIYCGRVLADEKQMKDYDVDGKVLHVAERPPPSQGGPTTRSNDNPPPRERSTLRGMRNSPIFRALDSMVTGLPSNGGAPINPFASSSSFCMNRITVARHMLDCANNIAAYLENPERGLNNTSLDILQRGRWTIESTVVEVGITAADIPQNQNIVEMVQGAVSAALRGNGGTNVTVLQLPTVFEHHDGEGAVAAPADSASDAAPPTQTESDTDNNSATVIIEDMSDSDDDNNVSVTTPAEDVSSVTIEDDVDSLSSPVAADANSEAYGGNADGNDSANNAQQTTTSSSTGTNTDQLNGNSRRRTPPTVLAEVITQWRTVQARLEPFIQQYYELLQSEPTFEQESEERNAAQRLFDRVSEAFHYLSHAQHAISDLMLDLSQPTPRYLTCHPILVEQSGYISSNNFLSAGPAAAVAAAAGLGRGNLRTPMNLQQRQTQTENVRRNVNSTATNTNISGNVQSTTSNQNAHFEDPVDDIPVSMVPRQVTSMNVGTQSNDDNAIEIVLQPRRPPSLWLPINNSQLPMARLIQAVVNSAPIDTEFHVQINAPIVSFGVPVHVATVHTDIPNTGQQQAQQQQATTAAASASGENEPATAAGAATATPTTNPNATASGTQARTSGGAGNSQVRVTTATLPTTSTQTRSTARPQLQIGQIPTGGFNGGRFVPNAMMSSFDRFLQCNSHHIRELENAVTAAAANNATPPNAAQIAVNSSGSNLLPPQGLQATVRGNSAAPTATGLLPQPSPFFTLPVAQRAAIARGRGHARSFVPRETQMGTENPDESRRIFLNMLTDIRNHLDTLPTSRLVSQASSTTQTSTPATNTAATGTTAGTATGTANNTNRAEATATSTPTARPTVDINNRNSLIFATSTPINRAPLTIPNTDAYRINLRTQLLNFLSEYIFQGEPINDDTMPAAVNRAIQWFTETLIFLPQYEKPEYNSRDSVSNILRLTLPLFINLLNDRQENGLQFEQRLKQIFEQFMKRLYSVLNVCIGRTNAEMYWGQLMRLLLVPLRSNFRDEALQFLCIYINPTIPTATDAADAQQFIVNRSDGGVAIQMETMDSPQSGDGVVKDGASTSAARDGSTAADDLRSVVVGYEPWHVNFPNDWLPVITRDVQALTENPPAQAPYSDAYIAGMATKRRKVLQSNKPPPTVNGLLAGNLRTAFQNVGNITPAAGAQTVAAAGAATATVTNADVVLDSGNGGSAAATAGNAGAAATNTATAATTVPQTQTQTQQQQPANIDDIISTIVSDTSVQASYAEALQTTIRERLRHDNDYDSSKFPDIGKYLNNK